MRIVGEQIRGEAFDAQRAVHPVVSQKRTELGGKDDSTIRELRIVERFDSRSIPSEEKLSIARIPDGEREHPVQFTNAFLTVLFEVMNDHLGVTSRSKGVTLSFETWTELQVIVDFAVVRNGHRIIFITHGLSAILEIDDGEAAVP